MVLCTSKDAQNKQPSEKDLQSADYIFDKIYNVDRMQLSNVEVVVEVLGCDVFFNKPEWVSSGRRKVQVERSGSNAKTPAIATPYALQGDTVLISAVEGGQEHTYIGDHKGGCLPSKSEGGQLEEVKKKVIHNEKQAMQQVSPTKDGGGKHMKERVKVEESCQVEKSVSQAVPVKKQSDTVGNVSAMSEKGNVSATAEKWVLDLSEAKQLEMSSLATTRLSVFPTHAEKAWDDNLAESIPLGRVLHIQNIDPSFTSVDIQDLLSCFFPGLSDAQMFPESYGLVDGTRGEALAIFETENFAELAFKELEENCLVLADSRRPLLASKAEYFKPLDVARFPGHFPLDGLKLWKQQQDEVMQRCRTVAHFSQQDTVEFEMAMEWENYRKLALSSWDQLHKLQQNEINAKQRST